MERAATLASKSFDIIFEDAPVMMHAIDRDGVLIKVNRQWLHTLGYKASEVLGRSPPEFLTDVNRIRVLRTTLPHFWQVGACKGIGLQFIRKNGEILDVLLDSEVVKTPGGDGFGLAALYCPDSLTEWNNAAEAIRVLQQLAQMRYQLEDILASLDIHNSQIEPAVAPPLESGQPVVAWTLLGPLLEAVQDVSNYLRSVARLLEQLLDTTDEHQLELLAVAKSIDKSLAELAGLAADKIGPEF